MIGRLVINVAVLSQVFNAAVISRYRSDPGRPHEYSPAYPNLVRLAAVMRNGCIQADMHSPESGIIPYPFYQPGSRRIDKVLL